MADATGGITDLAWISALYALGHKAASGAHPRQVQQEILEHIDTPRAPVPVVRAV